MLSVTTARGNTRCSDPKRVLEVSVMRREICSPCELPHALCLKHVLFAVLTAANAATLRHECKTGAAGWKALSSNSGINDYPS